MGKRSAFMVLVLLTVLLAAVCGLNLWKSQTEGFSPLDNISFYNGDAKGIRLCQAPVEGVYNLFVPGCAAGELHIDCPGHTRIVVNDSEVLTNGDEIIRYVRDVSEDGVRYVKASVFDAGNREVFNGYINFFFTGRLPSVYITVPEADIAEINAENPEERLSRLHTKGIMNVVDVNGKTDISSVIDMSRRGNTSFLHMDAKPYNINLSEPASILGMRPGRKLAFKAGSYDMNHLLRTEAAFDMARLTGMPGMFDTRFADVYINGIYAGLYQISNRIKGDELLGLGNSGYLLELDYRYQDEAYYFESNGQGIVIHYPEFPSKDQIAYISERYNEAYAAVRSDGDYEKYIDTESFMKMYIIQDFFCNVDVDYASFYIFLGDDGLFHAGPVWDFDLATGIMQTLPFHEELALRSHIIPDRGGIFLDLLGDSPRFMERLRAYYINEFAPLMDEYIYGTMTQKGMELSGSLETAGIQHPFHFKGFHGLDSAEGLAEWMKARNLFLKEYYENYEQYVNVWYHFAWGDIRTLARKGEKLGVLPDSGHPDNDEAFWGEITGFETGDRFIINEDFIPEEDTDLYAIYTEDSHAWEEGYKGAE
ncbi:MAG: CotH kinase family protein [Lachnospiraceae bacterium]|nr:CotH kinase family protein [Lachnospiraceae bacterium]